MVRGFKPMRSSHTVEREHHAAWGEKRENHMVLGEKREDHTVLEE